MNDTVMNDSLQQYLSLYKEHGDLLRRHAPEAMNRLREEALRSLELQGLPKKGSENYEITDLPAMLAPDYGLNLARIPLDVNIKDSLKCGIPHLTSNLFFMLNDQWGESKEARKTLPEGVEIGPLSDYLQKDADAADRYGKIADMANPIVALNTLLCQQGLFLKIKKGTKLKRPLQLIEILDNAMPLMAVRRLLIIAEEESEGQLLVCDHTASRDVDICGLSVIEIYVAKNARFDLYGMEESGSHTRRLSAMYLNQEEGSEVLIEGITLNNGQTRNEYHCDFKGEHCSLKLMGLGITDEDKSLDNFSRINHNHPNCRTEELFKYILDDDSKAAFTGRIYVAPGAFKTEAYQSNRNILGSEKARMYSKPQLEIYNDDVKCSHGSATGRIDAMQLFYLRSRGLDLDEAKLLLKQAFMADIVEAIKLPLLLDRVRRLIARRISGEDATCADCAVYDSNN